MSANFQLCGNMPDARGALKTSLSDGAKVPAHLILGLRCPKGEVPLKWKISGCQKGTRIKIIIIKIIIIIIIINNNNNNNNNNK